MPCIIDAHEDLAYNFVNYQRDYRRSVFETRKREIGTNIIAEADDTLLGWEEYQRGQVGLVVGTIFTVSAKHSPSDTLKVVYHNPEDVSRLFQQQIDYYQLLDQSSENQFHLVRSKADLKSVITPWLTQPAVFPDNPHPVGIMMSFEGIEGIKNIHEVERYWEMGVRAIGPVWAGGRFCGGTIEQGGYTSEGYELLKVMGRLGYILDLAHSTDKSALQALDAYEGAIIGSHANPRALLGENPGERHFTDEVIRTLAARNGVMGIVLLNQFLVPGWHKELNGHKVALEMVVKHIDYVCQLVGNARHVSFGTDFDGGYGYQSVPDGIDSVADLQKIGPMLKARGYSDQDIDGIFWKNWYGLLENALPV